MSDIAPLTVGVSDLQSCDRLTPYCRETHVVYDGLQVRYGRHMGSKRGVFTSVTLHPDVVSLFLFILCARVTGSKNISSPSSTAQGNAAL
jgi:hypothetical protein